ncbi:hypothetical protein K9N68_38445 (plasmid) [Kovacikia minuta CCNUW1]|uniref:hypothetical protein n=1 Tax=Kovacikia minuta TaxID=2931930 RepID=UPI001CCA60A3|nr:hypothetical protein [Kovacikia minuta]UBF30070.1 hypothetical protein K9N68_38445 [Kovacikia minuta CCNUW1]
MKPFWMIGILALLLTSCVAEPTETSAPAVGGAGGAAAAGGAAGGAVYQAEQPRQTPTPMRIDDPDQPNESVMVDYVWGETQNEADRNCQSLLAQYGMKFDKARRNSTRGKRWQCWGWSNHPESTNVPDRRRQ